jgi:hypothetical protein
MRRVKIGLEPRLIQEGIEYLERGHLDAFEAHLRSHTPMLKIPEFMESVRKYEREGRQSKSIALWKHLAKEYMPTGLVYAGLAVLVLKYGLITCAVLGGCLYLWRSCT